MNSMKVKDLREIAKSKGLRGYSRLKKSDLVCLIESHDKEIEKRDFLIEVCEDSDSDLSDCDPIFKKDKTKKNKVKVFKYGSAVIEVCEDVCEDLPDGW